MGKYIIGGIKTEYEPEYELLRERSKPYEADFPDGEAEIKLSLTKSFIDCQLGAFPALTREEHEYMWMGEGFYNEVLRHGGIVLHSSCVAKDGFAYLFSAKSGTGKSTHTHLWLSELDGTRIVNDDKPLIIKKNGVFCACGTPFSGKTDENLNVCVPIRALVFLYRSEENTVKKMSPARAVPLFLSQTINPKIKEYAGEMLTRADEILTNVPVFALGCNKNAGTGKYVYGEIERIIQDED